MKENKKIGGLYAAIGLGFAAFSGGKAGFSIIFGMAVIGVVAFLYFLQLPGQLPCRLELPVSVEKNKKAIGYFHIFHNGSLPIFYGKAYGKMNHLLMQEERSFTLTIGIMGKEEGFAPFEVFPRYMGVMEVSIEKIELYGLLGGKKKVDFPELKKEMMVTPKTVEISLPLVIQSFSDGEGEETKPFLQSYDPSVFYGIRHYREGDSLKHIHWNMTGKMDEYMIKELGKPMAEAPVLFLETVVQDMDPYFLDGLLEAYISISQYWTEEGIRHYLCWKDNQKKEWVFRLVENLNQLDEIFELLLRVGFHQGKEPSFLHIPEEKWESFGSWICVEYFGNHMEESFIAKREDIGRFDVFSEAKVVTFFQEKKRREAKEDENEWFTFTPDSIEEDFQRFCSQSVDWQEKR